MNLLQEEQTNAMVLYVRHVVSGWGIVIHLHDTIGSNDDMVWDELESVFLRCCRTETMDDSLKAMLVLEAFSSFFVAFNVQQQPVRLRTIIFGMLFQCSRGPVTRTSPACV